MQSNSGNVVRPHHAIHQLVYHDLVTKAAASGSALSFRTERCILEANVTSGFPRAPVLQGDFTSTLRLLHIFGIHSMIINSYFRASPTFHTWVS